MNNGFSWAIATIEYIMASTNQAQKQFNQDMTDMLARLRAGDPEALAAYQVAIEKGLNPD